MLVVNPRVITTIVIPNQKVATTTWNFADTNAPTMIPEMVLCKGTKLDQWIKLNSG